MTVLPFYFYWDMDWNRFVQSNTGYKWRHVPNRFHPHRGYREYECHCTAATNFVVTYNNQTYTNNLYFDTSVLDQNEINIYTTDFNALPYQWIREIGQQKRDYAYLTGYNIFGQNQTVISNYTNSATAPRLHPTRTARGISSNPGGAMPLTAT